MLQGSPDKVRAALTIDPKDGINIHQIAAQINSGRLKTSAIKLDPLPTSQDINVTLEHIPLDKLIELLNINGLSARGSLSGTLPIVWHSDYSFDIKHTELVAQDKGYISYKSANGLPKGDAAFNLIAELFQDFQYDSLRIILEKPSNDDLSATLDILGKNPKVQKGRPVHLKLNTSGKLMSLL